MRPEMGIGGGAGSIAAAGPATVWSDMLRTDDGLAELAKAIDILEAKAGAMLTPVPPDPSSGTGSAGLAVPPCSDLRAKALAQFHGVTHLRRRLEALTDRIEL